MNGNGAHDKINTLISLNELLQSAPPVSTGAVLPELYPGVSPTSAQLPSIGPAQAQYPMDAWGNPLASIMTTYPALKKLFTAKPGIRVIGGPGPVLENIALTPLVSTQAITKSLKRIFKKKATYDDFVKLSSISPTGVKIRTRAMKVGEKGQELGTYYDISASTSGMKGPFSFSSINFKYDPRKKSASIGLMTSYGIDNIRRSLLNRGVAKGFFDFLPSKTVIRSDILSGDSMTMLLSQAKKKAYKFYPDSGFFRSGTRKFINVDLGEYSGLSHALKNNDLKAMEKWTKIINKKEPSIGARMEWRGLSGAEWGISYDPFVIIKK